MAAAALVVAVAASMVAAWVAAASMAVALAVAAFTVEVSRWRFRGAASPVDSTMAASVADSMAVFGRRFVFGSGLGYGFYPYGYYNDYAYDPYAYYDDGGCYVVQRRVHTKHGWRRHPVQVCG